MRLIHRKGFALVYWVVAFLATVLAIIAGARSGAGAAPEFSDGSGTSVGSQILFGLGGAVLGGLLVAAIFAGVWIGLWALDRRANPEFDDRDDYDTLDDLDDDFDEAERDAQDESDDEFAEGDRNFVDEHDLDGDGRSAVRR